MGLAILASAVLLALPSAGQAAQLPGLLTGQNARHPFQVRPAVVGYTGDGTGFLGGFDGTGRGSDQFGHLTWLSWTTTIATGSGAVWVNSCEPNCAQGSFSPIAAKVRAFAPRRGHFTRLTLRYEDEGKAIVDERGVRHFAGSPGFYSYFIVHQARSSFTGG
jgi:hypothetical protein